MIDFIGFPGIDEIQSTFSVLLEMAINCQKWKKFRETIDFIGFPGIYGIRSIFLVLVKTIRNCQKWKKFRKTIDFVVFPGIDEIRSTAGFWPVAAGIKWQMPSGSASLWVPIWDKMSDAIGISIISMSVRWEQKWEITQQPVRPSCWWSMGFWLVVNELYDIILNNQQCFDFAYWPGHSTFETCTGSAQSCGGFAQITIS